MENIIFRNNLQDYMCDEIIRRIENDDFELNIQEKAAIFGDSIEVLDYTVDDIENIEEAAQIISSIWMLEESTIDSYSEEQVSDFKDYLSSNMNIKFNNHKMWFFNKENGKLKSKVFNDVENYLNCFMKDSNQNDVITEKDGILSSNKWFSFSDKIKDRAFEMLDVNSR